MCRLEGILVSIHIYCKDSEGDSEWWLHGIMFYTPLYDFWCECRNNNRRDILLGIGMR